MRMVSTAVVLLGALVVASAAAAADLELGKKIYGQKCASCHGPDGKGNAKMAQMLKVQIPDLAVAASKSDAELLKSVSEGKKPMPSFGKTLSKDELDAVVHYAKGLATGQSK
ncbi:MAG: cytochrome c [Candidatus Rokubacteria bacterium]|nr:cytochrome c [Candidatus Rokubacteria bacterium]